MNDEVYSLPILRPGETLNTIPVPVSFDLGLHPSNTYRSPHPNRCRWGRYIQPLKLIKTPDIPILHKNEEMMERDPTYPFQI